MTRGSSAEAWRGVVVVMTIPPDRGRGRRVARRVGLLHVADAGAGRAGRIVGQVEVLAEREALVVGRHVDPAQVAIALERDPEHVVGLALHPLGALPQEGDRRDARVLARQAVGDDPEPVRRRLAPEVVDDLHLGPGVDAGEVGEELEAELRLVVERPHRVRDVARPDPDLGLVVALADGAGQALAEARLEAPPEDGIHDQTPSGTVGPIARSGQCPRRSLMSCWSFIIP